MNRRKFCTGLAVFSTGAGPLSSLATQLHSANGAQTLKSHAIYDVRFGSLLIATQKSLPNADYVHTFHSDVAPIWYNGLEKLSTEKTIRMIGLTRHSEFFILKTLAGERDYIVAHLDEYQDHTIWLMQPREIPQAPRLV